MKKTIILLVVVLAMVGCKRHHSSGGTLSNPTFDGPWNGNIASDNNPLEVLRIDFVQGQTALSGTYSIKAGSAVLSSGTIDGDWEGNGIDFTFTQTFPCAGTFTFGGDRNGQQLPYAVSGTTGCFDIINGHGTLVAELPIRYRG